MLGPKGNSLKRLQEDTMCKMAVLGRGSMKDRHKVRNYSYKRACDKERVREGQKRMRKKCYLW